MIDSENKELRKRKNKRILIWSTGIIAVLAIFITLTILLSIANSGYITA